MIFLTTTAALEHHEIDISELTITGFGKRSIIFEGDKDSDIVQDVKDSEEFKNDP